MCRASPPLSKMSKVFHFYGALCATHPWEVIVAVVGLITCFLTLDRQTTPQKTQPNCLGCPDDQFQGADMVLMTLIRCLAILYGYHQFRNLQKLGSTYIFVVAGVFVGFSSFVFTSMLLKVLRVDLYDLKDALFFFPLLMDLSRAATLAQFALAASTPEEVVQQIARGFSVLGPSLTLDTVVETLVIGVGTLSGVKRLEMLSYYACLSAIVNYVIFMTFYPASLSLSLELTRFCFSEKVKVKLEEPGNPAVQRVKLIMSFGLLAVHLHSRWILDVNCTDPSPLYTFIVSQTVQIADHLVILILILTLILKFVFFEPKPAVQEAKPLKPQTETKQIEPKTSTRNLQNCLQLYRTENGASELTDEEIILLVDTKHIPPYALEKTVGDLERAVKIRRKIIEKLMAKTCLDNLPYQRYDYGPVMGACCENVLGYVPVPVGVAGPLLLDNELYYIPMATTEGCLVASTNRGCRALDKTGVKSRIFADGMTRGPVVRFRSITGASEAATWLKNPENFAKIKENFDSTSRFARLSRLNVYMAGRYLFLRFVAETGDAMGMNMVSKGSEKALLFIQTHFNEMEIISLSGNVCTDKKASAINWIEGRGKSVVCEATVPASIVQTVLKTSAKALADLNVSKNLMGSAVAGSIGGFNAHAANIVTAIYIATGQDPAQNVTSSNCMTIMEPCGDRGEDLLISCTMPSVEIGTVGGGTVLAPQAACLEMLGVKGPHPSNPGQNAQKLARIVCGAVLAGELSLMAALASGQLVKSHLKYNRSFYTPNQS